MNIDANREEQSPDENKGIENGVLGERDGMAQLSELKVDPANLTESHGATSGSQGPGLLQVQQQHAQTQGTVVCWERFLHVRTIRVLLVENDDCTRHIVAALLRNCNYEVLESANGLQAWKILEDLTNHIDIVLTEVVMPCLSGVGLLYRIMSHKTRKNIPVIMMSSHDSMGLVFKCLSKGAVDFLVKPVRKNELKNLWQHVWRRCHSSSGSGSESGTQTQKSVKSKSSERSGSASDNGENDTSDGLNVGDGSDDGSGTQSSWTKRPVEAESSQALSPMDQAVECPDSTCAQVIRPNAEHSDNKKVQISVPMEGRGQKHPDIAERGDLETIGNVEPKSEYALEGQPNLTGREPESRDVADKFDINNSASDDCKEPIFELSLKRLRGDQDTGRSVQDDRCVLRRSEQSAFSRYYTSINTFKAPNGITGSSSLMDCCTEVAKRESVGNIPVRSNDHNVYQSSNGVSSNIDMGSTTNEVRKDKSGATSTINGLRPSAFRPVKKDHRYDQQSVNFLPSGTQSPELCPVRGSHHEIQVQHHHQNYHHFHNIENQQLTNHDDSSSKKLVADAPHCGSTNALGGQMDGNPMNYSFNRSGSGSNHGSNVHNGSSTAVAAVGNNAESDVGQAGNSGSGDGSGNRLDENKLAQREAALIKFRQKRKERCFKKKVRYQNRKKLAEQRPRVRGQFVKQSGSDSSNRTGDE